MKPKDTYVNDSGGGRSSYSRSLEHYDSAYQKALSKDTKNTYKNRGNYHVGTWDDETEEYYSNGRKVDYTIPRNPTWMNRINYNSEPDVRWNPYQKEFFKRNRTEELHDRDRFANNNDRPSELGNVDLNNRPVLNNNGNISTVNSISFNDGQNEVLIPTIGRDSNGNPYQMSDEEAIDNYYRTGQHLGKFNSVKGANKFAQRLHNDQAKKYGGK